MTTPVPLHFLSAFIPFQLTETSVEDFLYKFNIIESIDFCFILFPLSGTSSYHRSLFFLPLFHFSLKSVVGILIEWVSEWDKWSDEARPGQVTEMMMKMTMV